MINFNVEELYEKFINMGLEDNTRVEITYPKECSKNNIIKKLYEYILLPLKMTVVTLKELPTVTLLTDVSKLKIKNIDIKITNEEDKRYGINCEYIIRINMIEK